MKLIKYFFIPVLLITYLACEVESPATASSRSATDWLELAGESHYGSGQWIAMLDSAILNFPEEAEPYYRKGVMKIRQSDYIDGMANLTKAARLDPKAYTNYLGLVKLTDLHDFEGAVFEFRKAIAIGALNDPVISGNAKLRLGLALKMLGKMDEAILHMTEYIEETGEDKVLIYTYIHRGTAYEAKGELSLAIKDFEKALSLWSKCVEAYYFLGKLLLKTGDRDAACRNAQKAILYQSFIRTNPSRAYIDQVYYTDLEKLFDEVCR